MCSRIIDRDGAAKAIKSLILVFVPVILGACVSSQAPDVLQVNGQSDVVSQKPDIRNQASAKVIVADISKQLLLPTTEGTLISVPQTNPQKSNSNQLALVNQKTNPTSRSIESINNNTNISDNAISTSIQNSSTIKQPIVSQPAKKQKAGLLTYLFQRHAKRNKAANEPVAAVDVAAEPVTAANVNTIDTRADGIVVPLLRPNQAGEIVTANNASVDQKLSTDEITNINQTADNPDLQKSTPNKQIRSGKKPGFFALLRQRNQIKLLAKSKPTDDRHNAILLSSRTSSRANRVTGTPITASLANISNVINSKTKENIQIASAAGLSRTSVNDIVTQHSGVNVDCISAGVVRILQYVEQRYGRKPVVTSGYRSPSRNRRAGGARNSMHIYCKAVDIQVKGVSKWNLAKYLRTVPGRGGVGTYCRTKSVHIDTGPKRDWHYSCRRKSKRKRKS